MIRKLLKKIFYNLPAAYILMFHHIDDGSINVKSGCILDKEKFIEIIDSGIEFAALSDCINNIRSGKCAITFDDGLADMYRIAYPELKKRNIPFTVFIVTDFLDNEGYITTEELRKMAADPLVTVGSHGVTHDIFKGMDTEKQKEELLRSKETLQKIINKDVELFAYSHGQYEALTLRLLKELKCYKEAFSAASFPLNVYTKHWRYRIPRINIDNASERFAVVMSRNRPKPTIKY